MDKKIYGIFPIGTVRCGKDGFTVELNKAFRAGLKGLEGFSHIQILWWGNLTDNDEYRSITEFERPYVKGPDRLGVFATRSPVRPNPVELSVAALAGIDHAGGILHLQWIDAEDGTPVIDIKPYHPSEDRAVSASIPQWCNHWPKNLEESGEFDWSGEFTYGD